MHKIEVLSYFLLWIGGISYSLYRIAVASSENFHLLDPNDFAYGPLLNKPKDISDLEWTIFKQVFHQHYYLIIIHIIFTQIISHYSFKHIFLYFILFSSFAIISILNYKILILILLNIFISIVIHYHGSRIICYLFFLFALYIIHSDNFSILKLYFNLDKKQLFLVEVSFAWLNAKCLSFSIDRIQTGFNRNINFNLILSIFGYCLYFPAFFTGPIYRYYNFFNNYLDKLYNVKNDHNLPNIWTINGLFTILLNLIRYAFWIFLLELCLYFIYSSSIQYYPELCHKFDSWTLSGLGYALPCLFYMKYYIIYGLVKLIASIDGFVMSDPPKCISRIHSCRYLWRYFDQGLHQWLKTYFYKPIIESKLNLTRQIIAGLICFSCIYLWHGRDSAVTVWCIINFVGVTIEFVGLWLDKKFPFVKRLSQTNQTRMYTALATPFFIISFASNLFFLSNYDVGLCFIDKLLFKFPIPLLPLILFMFAGSNVSYYCQMKESTDKNNENKH